MGSLKCLAISQLGATALFLDLFFGAGRKSIGLHHELLRQLAAAQHLDAITATGHQADDLQLFDGHRSGFEAHVNVGQVHREDFLTEDVLESLLGQAPLHRHLTTLEAEARAMVTCAGLLAFHALTRRLAFARANTAAKPEHLLQYAKMAKVYAQQVMGRPSPSIGLLNIGEEESKGTGLEKEAYKLLEEKEPLFIGNVEANEMFNGKTDCIVCDGYAGNITLKVAEGLMESVGKLLKREIKKSPVAILGAILLKSSLSQAKKSVDYSEYGGAPLLGVDGLVLISHGRSSPKAIKNAVRCAKEEIEHNVLIKIKEEMVK